MTHFLRLRHRQPTTHRVTAPHLAELYARAAATFGELPAFATRRAANEWSPLSFRELYAQGQALATALIDLGLERQAHIGLLADNRVEWIIADCATQLAGAANVPRGSDVTDEEIVTIFGHAGVTVAFVESEALEQRLMALRERLPHLQQLILMHPKAQPQQPLTRHLYQLIEDGEALRAAGDRRVEERVAALRPDDLFTLIYTSGTTGAPKGVMLTHANMISQIENIPIKINCADRVLSILPIWHVYERVFEMFAISQGCCTYYSSVQTLQEDLRNVEPTFMGSAPRLWESLHQRILKSIRQRHPMRRALFRIAYFLSHHYKESVFFLTGRRADLYRQPRAWVALAGVVHVLRWLLLLPWYGFFNAAVLEQVRLAVGGNLKGSVSGGGALPDEIDRFFNYLGIPVLEGYGLTETSPVLAVRTYEQLMIGTVGPMIRGTELRIVCLESGAVLYPDPQRRDGGRGLKGEVVVRGPQVMKGYYRNPEATAQALRNGWFHTGDIGVVSHGDCLQIVGRCKETIVLANGENLEPAPIELNLTQSPLIEQCVVVGQDRRYPAALIVPSLEGFRDAGWAVGSVAELAADAQARRSVEAEIKTRIAPVNGFRAHERIQRVRLLEQRFATGEELTQLLKVKRHVVAQKYAHEIESLYQ
ncbi:long-chain fatty acid--CoA ligase [Halorhodospira abdelmalekii]|uniref:AMP-dependent synthetase/ligase n=1 Tax=Halorhodospira abdelmalekii TaxID=421629 RepID=UPI0019074861|nr:long-chain fatty acid--CoA ligase [Halorhodospira abdelmalekii]MBK1735340.1 long-chain fatty acid--CoA ligase [Halorhodospira abdelmalekii]